MGVVLTLKMSTKIFLLICIISCFKEISAQVNSSDDNSIIYKRFRDFVDSAVFNVTRVRTTAELSIKGNELATLDFIGLVQQYDGYKAEEYDVQTEDGYILKLHRISSSPSSPEASNKPVVLMQHPLVATSDLFVTFGPKRDLAFMFADAGYDVWMGNTRGTTYSKRHVKYSPASYNYDFWNFNLDDVATNDIPTFIDNVLEKTNKTKLTYIGYSMGNTLNFILLSSKPEYNDKINLAISLAPAEYFLKPYPTFLGRQLSLWTYALPFLRLIRYYEILPLSKLYVAFARTVCTDSLGKILCANLLNSLFTFENVDTDTVSSIYSMLFNGASVNAVSHYCQQAIAQKFIKYDFGPVINLQKYNSSEPPEYDLSKITAPQAIFYAERDSLINPKGAKKLKNSLKNVTAFELVPKSYQHLDFVWAKNARSEYFYKILDLANKYSK